jgi:hypothetical protein
MKYLMLVLSFSIINSTYAQILRRSASSEYMAIGVYSRNNGDCFSFTSNPASLASLTSTSIGMYGERKFLLPELAEYKMAISTPVTFGGFGFQADHSGFSSFGESQLGLSYGRSLGNKIDAGIGFKYYMINVAGYGKTSTISTNIGLLIHLSDKLHAAFNVNNPAGGKFGNNKEEKLASEYRFGTGYDASDKFSFYIEVEKEEDQPVNVHSGFQYKISPSIISRTGIASSTSSLWLGIGLLQKAWRLDIISSYHPQLGLTPALLFVFNVSKQKS